MHPPLSELLEKVRHLLTENKGSVSQDANRLLDETWDLINLDPNYREVLDLPIGDTPESLSLDELSRSHQQIDREILEMLISKDQELQSIAEQRPLSKEELAIKAGILNFKKQLKENEKAEEKGTP